MGAGSRRLTERSLQICSCRRLRRPLLFRLAGKEGGEKGRLVTVWCSLPLTLGKPQCFSLAFHSVVTLRVFDYAPPDTGVSSLQLVALERLPSIEGAVGILMRVAFLRGTKAPLDKGSWRGAPEGLARRSGKGSPFRGAGSRKAD